MKYRIKVVKVTSPNTERPVVDFDIEKVEVKPSTKSIKVKFFPTWKAVKEAIRNDIFRS